MGCDELRHLLNTDWQDNDISSSHIVAHIRSCTCCHHGIVQLTKALLVDDPLSCDQCRARFPSYYEATRPDYPLVEMSNIAMAQTALHLSHCDTCREEYKVLVLLSTLEERNQVVDF